MSYTVIETNHDEVVTPYYSEFLPTTADGRVTNILLQDQCPDNSVEHVFIPEDAVALQWALNAVGRPGPADSNFKADCSGKLLDNFPDSSSVSAATARKLRGRLKFASLPARAGSGGKLRLVVRGKGTRVRKVRVFLHAGSKKGAVMGRSKRFSVVKSKHVAIALRRHLKAGRYVVTASGRDAGGNRVRAVRAFTLR